MKIISDKSGFNTKIFDDAGNDITRQLKVTKAIIIIRATEPNKVILECTPDNLEIVSDNVEIKKDAL